jgi:hypothetical protein
MAVTIENTLDSFGIVSSGGATPPSLLTSDGHTVGWYKYDEAATINYESASYVNSWEDYLGSGHDLVIATAGCYPVWSSGSGLTFDGSNDYLKCSSYGATGATPRFVYMVFKQITWTSFDFIFDGYSNASFSFVQFDPTPTVAMYASGGDWMDPAVSITLDTWVIVRCLFNAAGSFFKLNGDSTWSGTLGANDWIYGFTLGAEGNGTAASNIAVKEVIIRNVADSSSDETAIYNYLKAKYSL